MGQPDILCHAAPAVPHVEPAVPHVGTVAPHAEAVVLGLIREKCS